MIACHCAVCTSADKRDKRLRSSILIQSQKTTIVVDTTPDFRYQMLRAKVDHLDAVLFTHPHKDHIAGLDDVRAYNFYQHQPMKVYANSMTTDALMREFAYAFAEKRYPGVPNLDLIDIDLTPFWIGDIPVIPVMVWHMKMPVFGFRFGTFTYITDANRIETSESEKIIGSTHLVLNTLRREAHISHFTLQEAQVLAENLNVPLTFGTHISHQLGRHADVEESLSKHFRLAYDGLVLQL